MKTLARLHGNIALLLVAGLSCCFIQADAATRSCVSPPPGLVGWWPWENNGNDLVGSDTATLFNGPTFGAGKVGQALQMDNSQNAQYAIAPATSSLDVGAGANGLTIEFWIKPNDVGNLQPLVEWNSGTGTGSDQGIGVHFWLAVQQGNGGFGSLYYNLREANGNNHAGSTNIHVVSAGSWQHVALTYDKTAGGGTATIYVNGVVQVQNTNVGVFTPQTTYPLNFGVRTAPQFYSYNGALDEVSIYNRALTAAEINAIVSADSAGKCGGSGSPTTTTVTSSPNPSALNQQVTFTATVTSGAAGTPTGTVQFKDGGPNGTNIGSPATLNGSAVASVTTSSLSAGNHVIFAIYNGDSNFAVSTGTLPGGQTVGCYALPANLVAWYAAEGTFNDSEGPVFEDGTNFNSVGFTAGQIGQAFNFSGNNSVRLFSPTNLKMASALTVEAWVKPTSASGFYQGVVSRWLNSFAMRLVNNSGTLNLMGEIDTNGAAGGHVYAINAGTVAVNTWTHIAMTYSASAGVLNLYINGALSNSFATTTDNLTNVDANVTIGNEEGGSSAFFIGQIDEVAIFNRALSAAEITTTYNNGVGAGACKVSDPNLSNLTLSSGTLTPAFSGNTTSYTASVATSTTSITLTPTASDANTRITVNNSSVTSGSASSSISLAVGDNTINVATTAQDGTTTKLYTVVVNRPSQDPNTNADLSNLTLSAGSISPAFGAGTTSYTLTVPFTTTSTTVTPTVAQSGATVKVNGQTVTSGTASSSISLNLGSNAINSVVTALDGTTTKTYTVTVTRSQAVSTTAVASSVNPSNFNQQVTFTATVSGGSGTPTGTVQFKDNGTNLGSAVTLNGSGVGTTATSSLSIGTHTITAAYSGDSTYQTSTGTLSGGQVVSGGCYPPPANMVAWYSAENNFNDVQGATFENGTMSGSGVTFVAGMVGQAFSFNGSGFLTMGTPAALVITGNQVTLDGWINPAALDASTRIYFGRSVSGGNDYLLLNNGGVLSGVIKNSTGETFVNTLTNLPANTWSHIALTYDGTTIKVFLNGAVIGSAAKTGNIVNSGAPFVIGGRPGGLNFTGKIDEVEVFSRGLSDSEIASIYNAGNTGKCKSANADLSSLTLSSGTLSPAFASGTTSYTASVANSVSSITVTPTASDTNASITVNGNAVASGAASGSISLNVGSNTITTVVTAQDTTTKTYTVTMTRAASTNANLSNLVLSAGAISPAFSAATTSYTLTVPNSTTSTTVTPTVADSTATVKVNGQTVASGTASNSISLNVGSNTITTVVTAQDGTTTKTYTVTITRQTSSNANLSNLTLSAGAISPAFDPNTTSYTLTVPNTTTTTTVTPTVADSNSTVTVNGTAVTSGTASNSITLNFGSNTITTVVTAQDTSTKTYTVAVTRLKIVTTTAVTSSLNPSHFTQQVTFTATVTSSPVATGTVQFKDGGSNLGSAVTLDGSGVATLAISTLTPGTHAITADYGGDSTHQNSTGTLSGGQVVTCFEPPANLVGWYPAENTPSDIAGPTFEDGTFVGSATYATGEVGQAFSFNGANNYINVGSPTALKISTAITLDAWVRPTALPASGALEAVVTKWTQNSGTTSTADSFGIWLQNNGGTLQVFSAVHQSNGGSPSLTGGTVPLNTFTHVAMTYNSATGAFAIYVNGALVNSSTVTALTLVGVDTVVAIGREIDTIAPRFFTGQVDEVEIFSRALTATEIANIYNSGTTGKCKHGLVQLSAATYSVNESGPNAIITLTRTNGSVDAVSVTLNTSDGTAIAGSDYTAQSNVVVTWADGDTANKTVQIPITDDNVYETNETFNVALSSPTGGAQLGVQTSAVVTIVDNDSPPTLAIDSVSHNEGNSGNTSYVFTVTKTGATVFNATVNFATVDGTATVADGDYDSTSGTLTFLPGDVTKTITVTAHGDTKFENNETFTVHLSSPTNSSITTADGTGTLTNDDAAPTVQFSSATYSVNEGGGTVTVTVTKTGSTALNATVHYATSNGTATAGSDYTATSGDLTFLPGDTSKTFTVSITDDSVYEGNETFNVDLSAPSGATLGSPASAAVTIVENDPAPTVQFSSSTYNVNENAGTATLTITKTGSTAVNATVHYATSDGTATAGSDYTATSGDVTFLPNETSKDVTVSITNDSVYEGNENFTVTLSAPANATLGSPSAATVTIIDDDAPPLVQFSAATYSVGEGDGTVTITVTKTGNTAVPATVHYATSDGTATAGSDYTATSGDLTFLPNDTSKTFTVSITDDTVYEGNEGFTVTLSSPSGASVGAPNPATVTITENDAAPVVQFSPTSYSVNEAAGVATLTIVKSGSTAVNATVHYQTSDGTATAGTDYAAASGDVTFLPGDTSKNITVPILDPATYKINGNFAVTLSSPVASTIGAGNPATVTIVAGEISVEQPSGVALANGGALNFGLVRTGVAAPTKTFTIRNVGTADLTGIAVTNNGTNAADFAIDTTGMATTVVAGGATTFTVTFTPSADGTRSATLHIASSDADNTPFDIAANGRGLTAIEEWRLEHFGNPDNTGSGADNSDFDKDGLSNILEYATDSDPTQSSPPPGKLDINGSNLEFSYSRSKAAVSDGFIFAVQWSDSLANPNWNSAGVTESGIGETSTAYQVKALVPRGTGAARFVRLSVTPP